MERSAKGVSFRIEASLTQGKQSEEQQEVSIPADDSQPVCALSGERFDTFWDDAHEEWRFRDAVRLSAEQAARCIPLSQR